MDASLLDRATDPDIGIPLMPHHLSARPIHCSNAVSREYPVEAARYILEIVGSEWMLTWSFGRSVCVGVTLD
jgi:hypothetical protein